MLDDLREIAGDKLVLVEYDKPFNFSEKCNIGALHATGDRLVFLNDDVEVISDRWLENLVGPLDEPDVGLTGAKLYFSDGSIQHAGHGYWGKHYHHPFRFRTREDAGPFGELVVNREVTGVTAACAAIRREVFFDIGGFTEALPSNFNDVDFCYKITHHGLRTVWVANCELFHFESQTRDGRVAVVGAPLRRPSLGDPRRGPLHAASMATPMIDPHRVIDAQSRGTAPAGAQAADEEVGQHRPLTGRTTMSAPVPRQAHHVGPRRALRALKSPVAFLPRFDRAQ